MRVSVIGLGYVGLVTSAGLAEWGHDVVGVEASEARLSLLREGRLPFYEPGLDELVGRHGGTGRLRFASPAEAEEEINASEIVFIAVGTHDGNGGWQTDTACAALESIVPHMADDATLVIRSTLPPEFVDTLAGIVREHRRDHGKGAIPVLLNPEFTREARAIQDFMHPDRIVLGVIDDPEQIGVERTQRLYEQAEAPIVVLRGLDAAFSKLGANLFLATKISFANELAALCDAYGAQVDQVVSAMAYDTRIGGAFLRPGVGFGGSCLPHQVSMTVKAAMEIGIPTPLLEAVDHINHRQRDQFVELITESVTDIEGAKVALLGLTFKPHTDDLRDAPSLTIADALLKRGARVVAYDPMADAAERAAELVPGLEIAASVSDAIADADAIGLITEWPEFSEIDWTSARGSVRGAAIVDGRNALSPDRVAEAGFSYRGFGRGYAPASEAGVLQPENGRTPIAIQPDVGAVSLPATAIPAQSMRLAERVGRSD